MRSSIGLIEGGAPGPLPRRLRRPTVGLVLTAALGLALGCAASNGAPSAGQGGGGGASTGQGGSSSSGSSTSASGGSGPGSGGATDAGLDPDASCAAFSEEAKQAPAAMLIVLDKSASMTKQNKWSTAQLAIVSAIDKDVFDTMSLGLVTFPSSFTTPPQCLCDYCCGGDPGLCQLGLPQGVSCGISVLPQVALAPAGPEKSNSPNGGVRKAIYEYLATNAPLSNQDDGSPIYDALVAGYNALKAYDIEQRILVLVTDGGFSCTSVASPPRPGYSDGACPDWEIPDSVNALITSARTDPEKPIYTFIVGVPGSNSTGGMLDGYATPPYNMQLALSTYAVSGAPDSVDPACSKDATFSQGAPAPPIPCHIDLSSGAAFNADSLAKAIGDIRGKALGCIYELPEPPQGQTIDLDEVNVLVTVGGVTKTVPKRSNPSDDCAADGCWDYGPGNQVQILGKTCSDISTASEAKVEILVGCKTIVK